MIRYDGYADYGAGTDVGAIITEQVQNMQAVQNALFGGLAAWRVGRWMSYAIPITALPTLVSYNWEDAVTQWNATVNTWWGTSMTSLVAERPYERGQDGKTRIEAWFRMGDGIVAWAERIGKSMNDDSFIAHVREFATAFRDAARDFMSMAVDTVGEPARKAAWNLLWIALPLIGGVYLLGRAGFSLNTGVVKIGRKG